MSLVDNYFPFDSGPGAGATPDRWRLMARNFSPNGVIPGYKNTLKPTLSGVPGTCTVDLGGVWIDGFYGEIQTAKSVAVSGAGLVVARVDPVARQVSVVFNAGASYAPQQNLTGVFEIPLMKVGTTTANSLDVRQYAYPFPTTTHAVVAENTFTTYGSNQQWASTAWAAMWSWNFTKIRPDTLFDFIMSGSGYALTAGGLVELGLALTAPNASSTGVACHFYHNTLSEHHSYAGALIGWGSEIRTAGATGTCTVTVYVRCGAANAPLWRADGNDMFTVRVVERMP